LSTPWASARRRAIRSWIGGIGHFLGFYTLYEGPEGGGDLNLVIRTVKDGRTTVVYKDRNYLEEYEILEPNMKVRDKIRDLDARHGRHVGHEFG